MNFLIKMYIHNIEKSSHYKKKIYFSSAMNAISEYSNIWMYLEEVKLEQALWKVNNAFGATGWEVRSLKIKSENT